MNTTTRTVSPETHIRNLRNRAAQLTLKRILGTISDQERQELDELTDKLFNIEHNTGAQS
jgi:hypothetical protein